jgi:hypothetical protein
VLELGEEPHSQHAPQAAAQVQRAGVQRVVDAQAHQQPAPVVVGHGAHLRRLSVGIPFVSNRPLVCN